MPEEMTTATNTLTGAYPSNVTINVPPSSVPGAAQSDPSAEARVRHFQAEADRARAEAARAQAEAEMARKQIEATQQAQANAMEGIRQGMEAAQRLAAEAKTYAERERAERLRAEAVLKNPELAPFFKFIPATTDEAELAQHVQSFREVYVAEQEKLKAALLAQQPPTPPANTPAGVAALYPPGSFNSGAFNASAPATPAASGQPAGSSVDDMNMRLTQAREEALAKGDDSIFERALAESIRQLPSYLS